MALDRKIEPPIHDAIEFDYVLPPINEHQLDNGLPLYWLNAGVQDVVEIDWIFPAGLWNEPKQAVAHATAALLKNGTSKRSANEINEALEFFGASLKAHSGNDVATISLYTLTKHLPDLLPIIHEIITEATYPEQELEIYKKNTIDRLMISLRQCDFVANQKIDALLYGEEHPYGRYTKKENIEALTSEDLKAFHKVYYDLSNVKIFMAGNIGDKEVKWVNDIFGKEARIKQEIAPVKHPIPAMAGDKKINILNDPNGVQGAIRIGRLFPNRHHPDFAPTVVLNTLFGGYFGSRLMSNIREDKGYTYGIYSSLAPYLYDTGTMIIHTEAGRDVLEAAVKEVYHEMEVLCNEVAPEEELLLVKNYLLGNMLGDLDGPFSILHRWRTLILNDMTVENFNNNINTYKTITAKDLQVLAQRYYNLDDFYEVTVV